MKGNIVTKDRDEFLDREFTDRFERIFRDEENLTKKQAYLETMTEYMRSCEDCGIIYWTGTDKRCNCDYEKTIKRS